ncbi:MFS transporter [Modestobacter sp. I12A-02628]|uniref:MFS transporter n=1 Tax=Goekera deserti TaxID=2497753 RepID=A0A7K3WB33_9ACTN|nr:MFS transporter [Goekera deserti]MPQ97476.1 MFS transporter [Goekera deserti]NDI47923.1 MFS transporter [Goekera deserti]NEL53671.1 MFS transporter [Goekera deserti]
MSRSPHPRPADLAAAAGTAPRAPGLGAVVLAAVAVLVSAADTYVVVLAFPDILSGVGIDVDELQRATPIVGCFLLGYTATLPLLGRLADLRGRVPVLVGCLVLFALGSLVTATASDLAPVVLGRGLQGIGAGGMVPATLALVADRWPPERRAVPLGVVGAVQEAGAVLGPLAGAAVLAVSDWRAVFWLNLVLAAVLAVGLRVTGERAGRRTDWAGLLLGGLAAGALALQLAAPAALVDDVDLGVAYLPLLDGVPASTPLVLVVLGAAVLLVVRSLTVPESTRAALPLRGLPRLAGEVDVLGSVLLVVALGSLVWAFAAADGETQVVAHGAVLLPLAAVATLAFAWHERRAADPIVPLHALTPRAAWGALLVNLFVGVALVAALVDIPLFARNTTEPGDQLGAALVLMELLVAVPVGAVAGGWLCRTVPPRLVAAGGMLLATVAFVVMTGWGERSLDGAGSTVTLLAAGLGFGLAIAPVTSVLLAVTPASVHGSVSALAVVARTIGMLVGLSLLTAIALRRFTAEVTAIGSPFELCPDSPTDCAVYDQATSAAVLTQLHTVFAGAAVAAALAAVAALVLLRAPAAAPQPVAVPAR